MQICQNNKRKTDGIFDKEKLKEVVILLQWTLLANKRTNFLCEFPSDRIFSNAIWWYHLDFGDMYFRSALCLVLSVLPLIRYPQSKRNNFDFALASSDLAAAILLLFWSLILDRERTICYILEFHYYYGWTSIWICAFSIRKKITQKWWRYGNCNDK